MTNQPNGIGTTAKIAASSHRCLITLSIISMYSASQSLVMVWSQDATCTKLLSHKAGGETYRHDLRTKRSCRLPRHRGDNPNPCPAGKAFSPVPPIHRSVDGILAILRRKTGERQPIFCRRRHRTRRPPLAKIRPGRPAPAMGPGTLKPTRLRCLKQKAC
jgi:hypothetical protein